MSNLPDELKDRYVEGCWSYVPDGWRDLVIELDKELRKIDPSYELVQCKEKFGGLRYYVDFSDQCIDNRKADDLIQHYEHMSQLICDVCGKQGKTRSKNGWLATRCEEHN